MRKAKLHELFLPTKYQIWHKYIWGTDLQNKIGPDRFAETLEQRQAIEFVKQGRFILCKTLNESKIQDFLLEIYQEPYKSWLSYQCCCLARRLGITI